MSVWRVHMHVWFEMLMLLVRRVLGRVRERGDEGGLEARMRRCLQHGRRRGGRRRVRVCAVAPVRGERGRGRGLRVRAAVVGARGGCGLGDGDVGAAGGEDEGDDGVVVREEVGLVEGELVVEDIEELALDAADVALAEHAGAQRPVHVLQRRVVAVLNKGGTAMGQRTRTALRE